MSQAQSKEEQQIQAYQNLTARREKAREEFAQRKFELKAAEKDLAEKSAYTEELFGTSDIQELKKQHDEKLEKNDQIISTMTTEVQDIESILAEIKSQMSKLQ